MIRINSYVLRVPIGLSNWKQLRSFSYVIIRQGRFDEQAQDPDEPQCETSLKVKASRNRHISAMIVKDLNTVINSFILGLMEPENQSAEGYRFPFDQLEKWKAYLEEYGFVVIANYLPVEQCQKYVDGVWNIMEKISYQKLRKDESCTHSVDENYPPLLHKGMIQYIGHSQLQWDLRKACKPIFQRLWNNPHVKTSFDGLCFMNGERKFEKQPENSFLHTDQSPLKNKLWSYQGIMTLTDSGENQGGFVCVPRTHLYHQKYFRDNGKAGYKSNFYKFSAQEKFQQPICNNQKINTQAGDFILFDSRTFHCNTVPLIGCLRVCTYICMIPSKKVQPRFLEARKKAVSEKRTTCHHPGDGFRTFAQIPKEAKDPQSFKQILDEINTFEMDEQIAELI